MDQHRAARHGVGGVRAPRRGDGSRDARIRKQVGKTARRRLVLGNHRDAVAALAVPGDVLAEQAEVVGIGHHVPGAEAEYPAQPPPRHPVGQRVHVYRHVAFQKALKRRGRAREFGVLPRQQTALAERNDLLVQELFAAAQAISGK